MPTAKGISTVANNAPMQGPAQITQVAEDVDKLLPASVARAADLNATGFARWVGRVQYVEEDQTEYVYTGTTNGWQALAAPVQSGTISPAANIVIDARSYLKRRGKQVTMFLLANSTSGGLAAGRPIATIPAAFRPSTGTIGVMGLYTSGPFPGACGVYVNADGTVHINGYSTTSGSVGMLALLSYEI